MNMEKYFSRAKSTPKNTIQQLLVSSSSNTPSSESLCENLTVKKSGKRARTKLETNPICEGSDIISDPGLRKCINEYEPRIRDEVRRKYVLMGPCQPLSHVYPKIKIQDRMRAFQVEWFRKWEWLEYSISKDAAFCLWCYLFGDKKVGDEAFTKKGFRNWKKASEKFSDHVGSEGSAHNNARTSYFAFKDQRQSLSRKLYSGTQILNVAYRTRLTASVDVVRLLLKCGLAFRGHDESPTSLNRGNFLEILNWYSSRCEEVGKVVNENAPINHQLNSPYIQKDIVRACASETTKSIVADIGDQFFALLIDEARDSSVKEQMAVILRYVNNKGEVLEQFLGVVHVKDTTSLSLKRAIDNFLGDQKLSMSQIRGQGYDDASNMRGELNGLKALILKKNSSARYVHCFAHQLQLVIVALAQVNQFVRNFVEYMTLITNTVGVSCKRMDELRETQHKNIVERLEKGGTCTGRGKNQETSLARPGATRWGSHYKTILRLLAMWSSVIEVLHNIYEDGHDFKSKGIVVGLIDKMETYEFVFIAHLMKLVLGLTDSLSQFLQQKDQNIVNAMSLVVTTKRQLQDLRDNGWDDLLQDVNSFCSENGISIPNMEDNVPGRLHRKHTFFHHLRVEIFCQVVDCISQEMENRFTETNTELLMCIACLDPKDSFSNFSHSTLLRLAELYPEDFSLDDQMELKEQLKMWISEMKGNARFSKLENIRELATNTVQVGFHTTFHLVYLLIKLALTLPVATASVERAFSAMNIVKTDLRNKMGYDFLTDCLVCYIERDVFLGIDNETIIQHFQEMRTRRLDLPGLPPYENED
ncbi:hypothetical protein OROGR_029036 [Orobanche gracilis]